METKPPAAKDDEIRLLEANKERRNGQKQEPDFSSELSETKVPRKRNVGLVDKLQSTYDTDNPTKKPRTEVAESDFHDDTMRDFAPPASSLRKTRSSRNLNAASLFHVFSSPPPAT